MIEQLLKRRNVKYNCKDGRKNNRKTTRRKASPKLWVIGMNDLLDKLKSNELNPTTYTDDLVMFVYSNKTTFKEKFDQMRIIDNWCNTSCLQISIENTQIIKLGTKEIDQVMKVNDKQIEKVNSLNYLVLLMDKKIKFECHIDLIKQKVYKLITVINKLLFMKRDLQLKYKKMIYNYVYYVWFK